MPYCLNPDCPYRERVGKPAEFLEGIELCSDCGSLLSDELPEIEEPKMTRKFVFSDFHKRVLFTLSMLLLYRVLSHMPIPMVDYEALDKFLNSQGGYFLGLFDFKIVSVLGLGIMPYVSAYILVEILALFVPPLKAWRVGGHKGRMKLRVVALVGTLILALVQGYYIAAGIENIENGVMVPYTGLGYRLILPLTLTAGTFLTIWIADMITSRGIGHGISILILAGFAVGVIPGIFRMRQPGAADYLPIFIFVSLAVIVLIIMAEKTHKKLPVKYDDGSEAYIPLKLTTAGIIPATMMLTFTISIISLIFILADAITGIEFFGRVSDALSPMNLSYSIVSAVSIIFLYYLLTAHFYNSNKIVAWIKGRGGEVITLHGKNEEDYMDRSLEIMAFIGAMYLCLLTVFPDILRTWWGIPIYFGGVLLIKGVAIALDLAEDIRARRNGGNLIKVAEVHDVPTAGLAKSLLEGKGVSCHLRGYYHRALLYFFGPYIEISVLVPEEQASEAREAIRKYVGPELLVQQAGAE
jgi:preprotein translocase subunit SecY